MKTLHFLLKISLFCIVLQSFAAELNGLCDRTCQRGRLYELEKERLRQSKEMDDRRQSLEEQKYKDSLQREHDFQRNQLLFDTKKRCDQENMNQVPLNERSICNAVQGYFAFGIPVPDSLLGINNIQH